MKVTTQFALADQLKTSEKLKKHQRHNLVALTADLIKMDAIELWILKVNYNISI